MKLSIKPVLTTSSFKVLCVSGGVGAVLKKHKVDDAALLLVKKGNIIYQEEGKEAVQISDAAGHSIPADTYHQVTCLEEAAFFILIPIQAKMKFD